MESTSRGSAKAQPQSSSRHLSHIHPVDGSSTQAIGILRSQAHDDAVREMEAHTFYRAASMTTVRGDEAKTDQFVLFKPLNMVSANFTCGFACTNS